MRGVFGASNGMPHDPLHHPGFILISSWGSTDYQQRHSYPSPISILKVRPQPGEAVLRSILFELSGRESVCSESACCEDRRLFYQFTGLVAADRYFPHVESFFRPTEWRIPVLDFSSHPLPSDCCPSCTADSPWR
jgi:hypothetical protein